jgi:hypothetical protein
MRPFKNPRAAGDLSEGRRVVAQFKFVLQERGFSRCGNASFKVSRYMAAMMLGETVRHPL